jgi:hypothetical protein
VRGSSTYHCIQLTNFHQNEKPTCGSFFRKYIENNNIEEEINASRNTRWIHEGYLTRLIYERYLCRQRFQPSIRGTPEDMK